MQYPKRLYESPEWWGVSGVWSEVRARGVARRLGRDLGECVVWEYVGGGVYRNRHGEEGRFRRLGWGEWERVVSTSRR